MSSDGPKEGFAFVIDTDSYAGNFEREMCAYLTGQVGECEVGKKYVSKDIPKDWFNNVQHVPDDHGCYRPVSSWPNKEKTSYDSVAIFFDERPSQEQIDFMKERVNGFNEEVNSQNAGKSWYTRDDIKILGFRVIEFNRLEISNEV